MSNRSSDIVFQLIHSLEKSEKRHFKLYIKRSSSNENLKIVQLFDALDKQKEYDETALLKKLPSIQKSQLSNLKAHLYKQVLASLRLLRSADSIDLQLNEQFDYAHILYKKGLFHQSLRLLERAKDIARTYQKIYFLTQVIGLEKRIETLHITRSIQNKAETLSAEAIEVSTHIDMIARLSNLSLKLYSWYIRYGHARNELDEAKLRHYLEDHLPEGAINSNGFYEQLYLYQSFSWFGFIRQDFLQYYRYSRKWVELFHRQPLMKRVETGHYIKGLHNLLNAHFDLRNLEGFARALHELETFSRTDRVQQNDNFKIQAFIYTAQARINLHFLKGSFAEGLHLVPSIEENLSAYALFIDPHRALVLNYKIATLYFGSGQYNNCIDYLQKIINGTTDLRHDIQCYARLLHLLAHYELGNHELMEYLAKSVYRFMIKMENLGDIETEMIRFFRRSFHIPPFRMKTELEIFLLKLKQFETNRYHSRVFVYLDIVSWLEHKTYNKPLGQVIREKYGRKNEVRVPPATK
jgi:hypothetical protein